MMKSDPENSNEIVRLLFSLTQEEGRSVEIAHPNAEFDGPNSMICVRNIFEDSYCEYFGESVLDCLRQAHKVHTTERK